MARDMTKPLMDGEYFSISDHIIKAQEQLQTKRGIALILRSILTQEVIVVPDDMVEVFTKTGMNNRGISLDPNVVLSVDSEARTVTIPKNWEKRIISFEDVRFAIPEDSFSKTIEHDLDSVEDTFLENLDKLYEKIDRPSFNDDIKRIKNAPPEGDIGREKYYDFG